MTNCILWGDSPNEISGEGGNPTVTYSNAQGGHAGIGNINADPLFVDADGPDDIPGNEDDDLRLLAGSPCIDAADNTAVPKGIDTDLDGNPRFVDDPETKDTGFGDPPIVDMGPYEFQGALCPADFDNSGDVGVKDLLFLLGAWGPCPKKGDCLADFDTSGDVGVKDLLFLLGAWGRCR
ncbi:MAG: choice-of-anchor Q domain-containing protein [Phycisphaerae bacterium]